MTRQNVYHCKAVKSVNVGGREITGNVVPVSWDGKTHQVEVIMG